MAIIIKQGNKYDDKSWVGKKLTCEDCKCEFRLESKDKVKKVPDSRDGDYCEINCPSCKKKVTFYPKGGGPPQYVSPMDR